jgi:hypothetical protein
MSGIIPPSIINYEWTVRTDDNSFLNVSFPFRVRIQEIWFTTQQIYNGNDGLYGGAGNIDGCERELKLAAIKTKHSKKQWSVYDPPTDYTWGFNAFEYGEGINPDAKPTMWLGNPDEAAGGLGTFAAGGFENYWQLSQRSTAASLVEKNNYYNNDWNDSEYHAQTYVADVAVMSTDEMLQLFVYNSNGDWSGYEDDAKVTISIAYTGAAFADASSASPKEWTSWWND